jgi:hypothetical protein
MPDLARTSPGFRGDSAGALRGTWTRSGEAEFLHAAGGESRTLESCFSNEMPVRACGTLNIQSDPKRPEIGGSLPACHAGPLPVSEAYCLLPVPERVAARARPWLPVPERVARRRPPLATRPGTGGRRAVRPGTPSHNGRWHFAVRHWLPVPERVAARPKSEAPSNPSFERSHGKRITSTCSSGIAKVALSKLVNSL